MFDIIVGIHSIYEALSNPERGDKVLYATTESFKEFQKGRKVPHVETKILSGHDLQQTAEKLIKDAGHNFQRVPSNLFLKASALEVKDNEWLYENVISGAIKKIFCLDQVTDVHNGAAVLRTASFYGVDTLLISQKGSFGFSPSFYRIASGAVEHVPLSKTSNLSKTITKLQDMGVRCIGFSEHAEGGAEKGTNEGPLCLVMGAEDVGISHAVSRIIKEKVAFVPKGATKSLNVSVASAVAMEKYFGH